ncbi:AraC family transcriptional regulator [Paenibacillus brasilensis]|uniref:AraC family transcriptional regulator n=1 Tax=Paenibacillus brasilensis TaxID=128574 RepID=UPI001FCC7377|nr:AraC family transcriptional regulator [Paenibacillus brasilensis]
MGEQQINYGQLYTESTQSKTYLNQMLEIAKRITIDEGRTQTMIPFLTTMRYSRQTSEISGVLTPSICLILEGAKKLHLGQEVIDYRAGDYLVSVIDIPASAEIIGATKQSPYIGLRVDFTMEDIASVVMEAGIQFGPRDKKLKTGAYIGKADEGLVESLFRLLKLVENPNEVGFLSSLMKREMIFHLLSGDAGHIFFQQFMIDRQEDGIGKAVAWIKENYSKPFTIKELAKLTNMSVSGLHHKFKAVTTLGPVQYQKQLRLQEARRLILSGAFNITAAAMEVGYENVSQFSMEYRRLFGSPPFKDIKALRTSPIVEKIEKD